MTASLFLFEGNNVWYKSKMCLTMAEMVSNIFVSNFGKMDLKIDYTSKSRNSAKSSLVQYSAMMDIRTMT